MTKQTKTKLTNIFFACVVAAFTVTSCNSSGDEAKEEKTDPAKTETKTDAPPPATSDTTTMDQGDTRPVPSPN